ncbi:hypothetical protein AQ910_08660 [Burkholderia pseudomallei]|uniref:hypothetical protein n=1 Tax=Burkholderia pseudomallei TaxID=28450 RepID=UPI0005365353|nr:hypothetical protein [Burkholderia pseudomallei]AJX22575.1 hypothetical protein BG17_1536 [Burkholderia pseudomallei MSHR491]KGW83214.1 hypothetical protein Y034_615 [Burkholderia pseudomallei MSHR449]KGX77135.1 hypothetical protein Y033_2844 [Burkholderia pseudomallei MSHR435]ONC04340.1 hypothetical protein AQ910_08660 [Burkholderia pseudomallei]
MGFYGPEPFERATATYVWVGLRVPGALIVEVEGNAPRYTTGIQLVRDPRFVGGLKIDVMGWTGPLSSGTQSYKVRHTFQGVFHPTIVVHGSNKTEVVEVKQIPHEEADAFLQALDAA